MKRFLCIGRSVASATAGLFLIALIVAAGGGLTGCSAKTEARPEPVAPIAAFTGPPFLLGTVGSMTQFQNTDAMYVSGYGLVVLPVGSGTGSSDVPPFLRERMLNEIRKGGVGSRTIRNNRLPMTPEQFLFSRDTAVVAVHGFIPAGAVVNTRFDLYVEALPQTQTTSLAGGRLYHTELSLFGLEPSMGHSRPLAEASGPIYTNPFDDQELREEQQDFSYRRALIVAGGRAIAPRGIQLRLNQPNNQRAREIADQINLRFGREPGERGLPTANAVSPALIELSIPRRFAHNPQELVDLIAFLFVDPGSEEVRARELAEVLRQQPQYSKEITLAWKAMGRLAVPVLRELYVEDDLALRLAALEAGAWLNDARAGRYLSELALHEDAAVREQIARVIGLMPEQQGNNVVALALRRLLSDPVIEVRLAAYHAIEAVGNDRMLYRYGVRENHGVKFFIDRVVADTPMIYITQDEFPRLVIFGPEMQPLPGVFHGPDLPLEVHGSAALWGGRLRMRPHIEAKNVLNSSSGVSAVDQAASVSQIETMNVLDIYYRPTHEQLGKTYQAPATVATLAFLLGHNSTELEPTEGLNLSYSQVVDAIYNLAKEGHIRAEVKVHVSPLAREIQQYRRGTPIESRPDTATPPLNEEAARQQDGPADQPGAAAPRSETGWTARSDAVLTRP